MVKNDASGLNQTIWARQDIANLYSRGGIQLFPAEDVIIKSLKEPISQARLLDLGIGAGRTTEHVRNICREYVGVDYSPEMVKSALRRFPDADLRLMDARDLSSFVSQSFDFVLFSFNGLDYVSHEDRLRILREVHRVLRTDGVFMFSSHNRNTRVLPSHSLKNLLPLSINPLRLLRNAVRYAQGLYNSLPLRRLERQETEYALLNDAAHHYRLVHYYIAPRSQIAQLNRTGFEDVQAYALDGSIIDTGASGSSEVSDYMIHYVARRA